MNFILIIVYEYIIVAIIMVALLWRDQIKWYGLKRWLARIIITFLIFGILIAIASIIIYPNILTVKKQALEIKNIDQTINIAFVSDIQVGNHKKTAWVEKIVKKIDQLNPDLVILGGDLIDNEGTFEDETQYLEPLAALGQRYPIYAIMGNHEYGIGNATKENKNRQTGDRSEDLIARLKKLNIPLLRNQLSCPTINKQPICLFGIDDIWSRPINFSELKNWPTSTPIIFLTHNPDGIMFWPTNIPKPNLVLAGHTHGGQVWIPGIGPLGSAGIELGDQYYRGLNYWNNIPIYTSVGAGESVAPLRFWVTPEIVLIQIKNQLK